ncbi:MAG: WYL domain-containing protein [Acidobacteriota bacterium]
MTTQKKNPTSQRRVYLNALGRVHSIHKEILSGSYPSVTTFADDLGVTPRTVKRDLDVMRFQLNAPIVYDRKRRGFTYTAPGWALPMDRLTEGEMLAFFIAENALRLTGQSIEALKLKNALVKLAAQLPDAVSVNLAALGERVSFQNPAFVSVSPQVLHRVASAAAAYETIEFDYYSPHKQEPSHRTADVHLLHNFAGDWYAISFDHDAKDFRDFHVGRMSALRETGRTFTRQIDWDADEHLSRGFYMMRGGRITQVAIRFDTYQAQWIRERHSFHPLEQREELPDGSLRLSFKIGENGLEAVARFCLMYSDHCVVEKPKKLRILVKEKLQKGLKLHE